MENVEFRFDGNYLVAEISTNISIVNYQLEMLTHNKIKGLLVANKQVKNDKLYIYYDISSKISVTRAVMGQKMSYMTFVNFASVLMRTYMDIVDYQFTDRGIVLANEYIFVNPITYEPSFVYLPISRENTGIGEALFFLRNMLVSNMVDVSNGNITQQLIGIFNGNYRNPAEVLEQLERIGGGNTERNEQAVLKPMPQQINDFPQQQNFAQQIPIQSAQGQAVFQQTAAVEANQQVPVPQAKKSKKNKVKKETKSSSGKSNVRAIMIAVAAIIIVAFAAMVTGGIFDDEAGNTDYTVLIAAPILIFVIDYFIYKKFSEKSKKKDLDGNGKEINVKKVEVKRNLKNHDIMIPTPQNSNMQNQMPNMSQNMNVQSQASVSMPQNLNMQNQMSNMSRNMNVQSQASVSMPQNSNMQNQMPNMSQNSNMQSRVPMSVSYKQGQISKSIQQNINIENLGASTQVQQNQSMRNQYVQNTPAMEIAYSSNFSNDFGDKTMIITPDEQGIIFLDGVKGGKIIIKKGVTRIGKLSGKVDEIIDNPKVSRVHADIILRDGQLYVMDLSSLNGTYINSRENRLSSNVEYKLNNNDRVIFANEEYIVHI